MMKLTPWNKMIQNLVLSSTREGMILAQILMDDYEVISHWIYAPNYNPLTSGQWDKLNLPRLSIDNMSSTELGWTYIFCSMEYDAKYMQNLYDEYLEQNNTGSSSKLG